MAAALPWLPAAVIARGANEVPVPLVVREWSARWFAGEQAAVRGDAAVPGRLDGTERVRSDGLAILAPDDALGTLATLMFGSPPGEDIPTPADRALLDTAAEACLSDLQMRLATAYRLPPDMPWRPAATAGDAPRRWAWRVEAGRRPLLHVVASEALIVQSVKASLAPAVRGAPLGSLADALTPQAIAVSGLVGHCRLTTTELRGLAPGDVVVLDRRLDERIPMAVDLHATAASCLVEERDECLNLIFAE